jgi:hypothetical protein
MFTTQHDRPFRLILYWNQTPPSGSSCIGREWNLTRKGYPARLSVIEKKGVIVIDIETSHVQFE